MADNEVYKLQRRQLKELMEAITMASNRLEAALLDEKEVCRACVETAKSYLDQHVGRDL